MVKNEKGVQHSLSDTADIIMVNILSLRRDCRVSSMNWMAASHWGLSVMERSSRALCWITLWHTQTGQDRFFITQMLLSFVSHNPVVAYMLAKPDLFITHDQEIVSTSGSVKSTTAQALWFYAHRVSGFTMCLPGCPWPSHSTCASWCSHPLRPPSTCQKCRPGLCLCIQPWSGQTLPAVSPRQPRERQSIVRKEKAHIVIKLASDWKSLSLLHWVHYNAKLWNLNDSKMQNNSVIAKLILSSFQST